MKTQYHIEITQKSLDNYFSQNALDAIVKANIRQDRIIYQFGHDHIHFDGSAFDAGFKYISHQENRVLTGVKKLDFDDARKALGCITHTWQDFYSHSNYVKLWMEKTKHPRPEQIVPDDDEILHHPELKSGRNYGVIEFIVMVPGLSKIIMPLMPVDSHAQMNLDSPTSGAGFNFAFWAALKRTYIIFESLLIQLKHNNISWNKINGFLGK